jgi:uncharacterized protein YoxC
MVFEICAVAATLILSILAYFIIQSLRELQHTLKKVNEVTSQLQTKIDPIGGDALRLLEKTNAISASLHEKLETFTPFFNSIHQAGQAVEEKTSTLAQALQMGENERRSTQESAGAVFEWVARGILLWQQMKKKGRRR